MLCRSLISAQTASPTYSNVYAALVAVINSKFPQIGELLLRRVILQFRRSYRRNDKAVCLSSTRFLAHLVNQQVVGIFGEHFLRRTHCPYNFSFDSHDYQYPESGFLQLGGPLWCAAALMLANEPNEVCAINDIRT